VPALSDLRGLPEVADPPSVASRLRQPWGATIGNFFLLAGAAICVLGCCFAVFKTLYGLWTLEQLAGIISVSKAPLPLVIAMILLDGCVWFCFFAALVVVFVRVYLLRD
jgi:hypothetical protein